MRTFVIVLVSWLMLGGPGSCDPAPRATLAYDGRERTYYLLAPGPSAHALPLVILLHGSGGNGQFMVGQWQPLARRENIALVAPDSLHRAVGWSIRDDGPDFIRAIVADVAAKYPIDPRRIYLFGQSGGAVYALTLGMLESEYFAAVAFHAGGWRRPAEYAVMRYAKRKIPIAMYVGDRDEFFSLVSVQATERALKADGFPAELHVLAGRKHAYADIPGDFHDTMWSNLRSNALDDPPKFTAYRLGPAPLQ